MANTTSEDWGDDVQRPVELAVEDVPESQLEELIKEFIVPSGTDYGLTEAAFQAKERTTRKSIASGSLKIIFDAASDTTMLMSSQDWRAISKS